MLLPPTDWIEKIIRIDSITHRSNEEIVRFLIPLLRETGLKIEEQKVIENGQTFKNLLAYSHELDSPGLLVLNTHLDTVSGGVSTSWTKTHGDPLAPTRVRDRIYGLGTADVKLDFLCKLWAARVAKPWVRPFVLVGTYGEERGLVGVQQLFNLKHFKPRYAMVGEPSNLELIYAHKGHLIFTLSTPLGAEKAGPQTHLKQWKGKSAHSSTPELGTNAIRKALNDVFKRGMGIGSLTGGTDSNRIPDYCEATLFDSPLESTQRLLKLMIAVDELSRELKKRKDARFTPATSQVSLNQAETREGKLYLTFDIRLLPDFNAEGLSKKISAMAKQFAFKVESLSVDCALKGNKNGKLMQNASRALKACGIKVVKRTKASSTEAAIYAKNGAEAIVFGPGISIGNVHRPNEFNSFKQLSSATRFYAALLQTPQGEWA